MKWNKNGRREGQNGQESEREMQTNKLAANIDDNGIQSNAEH